MAYWLFKTEPDTFSIRTLATQQRSCWEGVRNYQARNMLRDDIAEGDEVLIYHSSCKEIGVAGIAKVIKAGYPDHFAFDETSEYFDAKSTPENPRWFMVDIEYVKTFPHILSLDKMKAMPALSELPLVKRGNRLSVMPVTLEQWQAISRYFNPLGE